MLLCATPRTLEKLHSSLVPDVVTESEWEECGQYGEDVLDEALNKGWLAHPMRSENVFPYGGITTIKVATRDPASH